MATVYLGEDLRHHRQVAIKLLRPELGAVIGAERFLAEIRTTANLQHPHILPLFDSGEAGGLLFYVMPFVEGETLRDRLEREKQLPVADAVRIASEVASALDYAHRRGVIHRDIKPENVLLHDGQALVADFGIALAVSSAGGASRMTETGMSLGTPHYMSPEQAMGERQITARSDVYALGAMTYEMLVGEPPFTGPTAQAIVAKVMTAEPVPPDEARKSVPEHVSAAVLTALEKLPADRFASAADFAAAIGASSAHSLRPRATTRSRSAVRSRGSLAWIPGGVVVLAAGVAAGWLAARSMSSGTTPPPPSRLAVMTPDRIVGGAGGLHPQVGLTPDGSTLLYTGGPGGGRGEIVMRALDAVEGTPVSGTLLRYAPRVSPDGRWIAARTETGDVVRLSARGQSAATEPLGRGLAFYAWHPDGSLWVTRTPYRRVERIAADGAVLEVRLDSVLPGAWLQQILDDGRMALAIAAGPAVSSGNGVLLDLETGRLTTIIDEPVVSLRAAAGYLVYARPNGTLMAAPFDSRAGRTTGAAVTLATDVSITGSGDAQFDMAANGTIAYIPEEASRFLDLLDRQGRARLALPEGRSYHMPRFSPDGRRIATDFSTSDGRNVWVLDLEQQTLSRATFEIDGHDATWSPDGAWLTYTALRDGMLNILRIRPGSGAPAESLFASRSLNYTGDWLPDGSALVTIATELTPGSGQDIAILRNAGRGPLEPLVATPFRELYSAPSPDGRWIAYVSDQSGRNEVYVRAADGTGAQRQVSQAGGDEPVWARSGRELFYRRIESGMPELMVATVETAPEFRVTARQALFSIGDYAPSTPHASYDVSPDGSTFVMVRRNPSNRIMVLQGLAALVRRAGGGTAASAGQGR
jgi:eukaryotic-like serine/threonine-protein kinase